MDAVWRTNADKPLQSASAAETANLMASHPSVLKPVYVDFAHGSWADGLYLSDYAVDDDHHYRTNFENSAIITEDETLHLKITESSSQRPWDWDSAEVQVVQDTGYGLYEVVMRPAQGSGLISSFFTYTGPYYGDPHDEIDIEFIGKNRDEVEFNTFRNGRASGGKRHELGYSAADEFHLYAFDWRPESVKFYVDGQLVHEVSDPKMLPSRAGRLMINLWTGTLESWHGEAKFQPGETASYKCLSYRPTGNRTAQTCSGI